MKTRDIEIKAGELSFRFRGVFDIRLYSSKLSFSKAMKLKKGPEYKIRYSFDLDKFKEKAVVIIEEQSSHEQKRD